MKVSLTSFVDYALKSGKPKLTCANKIREQLAEGYEVPPDYYKRFRDGVVALHKGGHDKKALARLIGAVPREKTENYKMLIAAYTSFMGKKNPAWFLPKKALWNHGGLTVSINPELGLQWEGNRYLIKLYNKTEKLTKDRISCVLALMQHSLNTQNCRIALLDVRNGKLHEFVPAMSGLIRLAESEALSLEHLLK